MKWINEHLWNKDIRNRVVSTLIASAILGIATLLWSKSHFSFDPGVAWTAATSALSAVWAWLVQPVSVPWILFWFFSLAGIALAFLVDRRRGRHIEVLERHLGAAMLKTELARFELEEAKLGFEVQLMARAAEQKGGAAAKAPRAPPKVATWPPPVETLDQKAVQLLRRLCREYPGGDTVGMLASHLGLKYPAAEKLIESVAEAKLIEFHQVRSYDGASYWKLSKAGRDYCLANNLN